jgi:hypothetical protein
MQGGTRWKTIPCGHPVNGLKDELNGVGYRSAYGIVQARGRRATPWFGQRENAFLPWI